MRLFAAVEINQAVTRAAASLIDELRVRCRRLAPQAAIRWVPPTRVHLTLVFIGEVNDRVVPAMRDGFRVPFTVRSFAMRVCGTGAFPEIGRPRVLWAGVDQGRGPLDALAREAALRVRALGMAVDARHAQPHLTLGRVRNAADLQVAALLRGLESIELGTMTVGAITLFESRLLPAGAVYSVVERVQLREAERP